MDCLGFEHQIFIKEGRSKEDKMSIFPTKILLATDGSEEATFAARTALDVAHITNSALHVVHVKPPLYYAAGYNKALMLERRPCKYNRRSLTGRLRPYWTLRWSRSKLPGAQLHELTSGQESPTKRSSLWLSN